MLFSRETINGGCMSNIYLLSEQTRQRRRFFWTLFFLIFLVVSVYLLGLEFINTEVEKESWLKITAGIAGCTFTIYGLKIILKLK